ncbi:MAG TPA: Flp family type IVb pilin [Caulobacteraceae bacterium]
MARFFNRLLRDRSGATAIEYGLIAALVAVVIIVGVTNVGTSINGVMTNVAGNIAAK